MTHRIANRVVGGLTVLGAFITITPGTADPAAAFPVASKTVSVRASGGNRLTLTGKHKSRDGKLLRSDPYPVLDNSSETLHNSSETGLTVPTLPASFDTQNTVANDPRGSKPAVAPIPNLGTDTLSPAVNARNKEMTPIPTIPYDVLSPGSKTPDRFLFDSGGVDRQSMPSEIARDSKGRWVLPLEVLGMGTAIRLSGLAAKQSFSIPIPPGLHPVAFIADAMTSPDVSSSFLEVAPGDQPARTIDFGSTNDRGKIVQARIPLSDAVVVENHFRFSFTSRLRTSDDTCSATIVGVWLDLRFPALVLEGEPFAPSTVADFFPPLLRTLTISLPEKPNSSEVEAAAALAAIATMATSGRPININVKTQGPKGFVPNAGSDPTARVIRIDHRDTPEIRVMTSQNKQGKREAWPTLVIGGDSSAMAKLVRALAGKYRLLTQGRVVTVQDSVIDPLNMALRRTFSDLGIGTMEISGSGELDLPLSVSQTSVGGPINKLRFHIVGANTAIPATADANISVLINGDMIASKRLSDTGTFEFDIEVPKEVLNRDTSFLARINFTPPGGICRLGVFPFTVQILQQSFIDIERGQGLEAGFDRYPQVLLPRFLVGLDAYTSERIELVARLTSALQRSSKVILHPTIVPFREAFNFGTVTGSVTSTTVGSLDRVIDPLGTTIVIGESAKDTNVLETPFGPNPMRVLVGKDDERLRYNIENDFAVLEADALANGGNRLLLTWRGPVASATDLVDQLLLPRKSWSSIHGDTFFRAPATPALDLSLRRKAVLTALNRKSKTVSERVKPLFRVGAIFAVVLLLGLLIRGLFLQRRKRRILRVAPGQGQEREQTSDTHLDLA